MRLTTFKRIAQMMVTEGPRATYKSLLHRLSEKYHEGRLGISTAGTIQPSELGIDNELCHEYGATDYGLFRTLLDRLDIRPGQDVLLDLGSGLGRALIVAGERPFRRVLGVEFSAELDRQAQQNLAKASARLVCRDITTTVGDAAVFDIPTDVTIVYFNNAFHGAIFAKVLENLEASVRSNPRRLRLVCNVPLGSTRIEDQVRACPWLTKEWQQEFPPHRYCYTYTSQVDRVSGPGSGAQR